MISRRAWITLVKPSWCRYSEMHCNVCYRDYNTPWGLTFHCISVYLSVCLSALILCLSRFFLSHFSYHDNKWLIDCINKGCSGMLNAVKKLLHVLDVSNVSPSSELWTSAYNTFFTAFSNEVAYRQPTDPLCTLAYIRHGCWSRSVSLMRERCSEIYPK